MNKVTLIVLSFFFVHSLLSCFTSFGQEVEVINPADTVYNPTDSVYSFVENLPEYPGGDLARIKFLINNLVYPEAAEKESIQGTVYVTFIVEKSGRVSNPKIFKGIGGGTEDEVIRVLQLMPRWKPGKHKGKFVRVGYCLPIKFTLPVEKKN